MIWRRKRRKKEEKKKNFELNDLKVLMEDDLSGRSQ